MTPHRRRPRPPSEAVDPEEAPHQATYEAGSLAGIPRPGATGSRG